ncbi:MAG: Dynamin family protein, partial [Neobacillus sp.]|nr:Dynamin family protein [Neobacillus sp.]
TEAGKEVYLVINQVDKHRDEELSFPDFQQSVLESFSAWGVKPARIYYTSLKFEDHQHNEFKELQQFISQKLQTKDQFLQQSIFHSLKKIAQDHLKKTRIVSEEELRPAIEILNELSDAERQELQHTYQEINTNLQTLAGGVTETEREIDTQIAQILKNAYLMPFQTRELAEAYLEACQPEFKVGLLFTKQKTQEEKNARRNRFYQELLEKTKSQLEWHLREFLLTVLKEHNLENQDLQAIAQAFTIKIPVELVDETVKQGARLSGEYVLHYTEDIANGIKKIARREIDVFKTAFLAFLVKKTEKLKKMYHSDFQKIERYMSALEKVSNYEDNYSEKEKLVTQLLTQVTNLKQDTYQLFNQEEQDFEVVYGQVMDTLTNDETALTTINKHKTVKSEKAESEDNGHVQKMIDRLERASKLVTNLPGFKKIADELAEKADRLAHRGFTVALFGAFSAGKSSFANALMGEKVLPVSPNPTTAAINKIKPVTERYQHGTVLVKFKDATAMLEDVNRSLKFFELQVNNLNEASKEIDKVMLEKGQEGVSEKTHYAFLQAFKHGCKNYVQKLGTVIETDLNEFTEFVAREERSCFVEWIELYYDCELTRKGITLVDTPGADSINARHTGVAFDYIKNSDAILFVTYYNHAFSKADREFLIQLGRVKESFQLDKMFFIINAIDLAENEEEQETVTEYVKDQLVKYGISHPHLYPLSSLLAIREKLQPETINASGLGDFENDFYHFISNDLTKMAVTSAGNELQRVQGLVDKMIQGSREDQSEKDRKRLEIKHQKEMIKALFNKQTKEALTKRMSQESAELIFYIKQRVLFRFNDFFKEAFNPSALRDDGRNLKKALQSALDEFLESLGFDLSQEMRATTVRLDRFAEKILADYQKVLIRNLVEINDDLSFSTFETNFEEGMDFPIAFSDINKKMFTKAMSYFKNPKAFFEKNEKKLMSDELQSNLSSPVDDYLKIEAKRVEEYYTKLLSTESERLISQMNAQVDDFYYSLQSALDGGVLIEDLLEVYENLAE